MIIDSSAIVAILKGEAAAERIATAIVNAAKPKMSAANWLETTLVADSNRNPGLGAAFDALMQELSIAIIPFDAQQADLARAANQAYGRSHAARLNYGDCMAYALAKSTGEPLLFVGDDFTHTDITPALA